MKTKCEGRADSLEKYVLGILAQEDEKELLAHIEACSTCRNEIEDIRRTIAEFKISSARHPESFATCEEKIKLEISHIRRQRNSPRHAFIILKIAASILIVCSVMLAVLMLNLKYSMKAEISWKIPNIRNAFSDSQYPVLCKDRIYALTGDANDTRLISIDKNSGAPLWKSDFPVVGGISSFGGMIFTVRKTGDSQSISALDGETGKILWNYELPSGNNVRSGFSKYEISAFGNGVCFVQGKDIFFLDRNTGAVKWKVESLFAQSLVTQPQADNGRIFVADTEHVHCIDSKDGTILWTKTSGKDTNDLMKPLMAVTDGRIFVSCRTFTGECRLFAMDAKNGETLWQREIGIPYWIRAGQGFVFVKSHDLDLYDFETGHLCRTEKINGCSPLAFGKDEIFIVEGKDSGKIVSLNLKNGRTDDFINLLAGSCNGIALDLDKAYVSANDGALYAISLTR